MHTPSRHDNLTAETLGRKAVVADACRSAGQIPFQTDRVGGRRRISDSGNAALRVGNNFIHACHNDNVGGALNQAGNPIAVAVNIDELTVQSDGIGTHKIIVGENRSAVDLSGFLRCFCSAAIQQLIGAAVNSVHQTAFFQGFAAAPADDCA